MNDERFELLVEKHLQSLLTDEEARELAQALEGSVELRRRMLEEVTLSGILSRKHAEPVDLVPKVQAALRGEPDRSALVDTVLSKLPEKRPVRTRSFGWLGGLAAAAAIVAIGVIYFNRTAPPAPTGTPVATRASGEPVMAGETVQVEAPAKITYDDGSHLTLSHGSAQFVDDERVRLERGRLSGRLVAYKVIVTPQGEAKGFGTDLALLCEADATRISVDRGSVTFTRGRHDKGVRLGGDQYAVVSAHESDLPVVRKAVASADVKAALRKAADYLKKTQPPSSGHYGPMSGHALIALAMIHAGVAPEEESFQGHLDAMLAEPLRRTYVVSIQAMVLQALDPEKYRGRLAECAQFLVDNQCANGQWAYGEKTLPPDGDRIVKRRDGEQKMANNSCSQIALLGVRACADAGLKIPVEVFARAAGWWATSQRPDKDEVFGKNRAGWCYNRDEDPHHPYGSMTAGGIAASILADAYRDQDWTRNPAVQAAVRWLGYHYSAHENYGPVEALMDKQFVSDTPQPATEYFYYLWALERAGTLIGTELLGAHDWYAEGAEAVLAQQRPDGSWHSGVSRCKPAWDTAYAILFLTRATRPLEVR